MNNSDVDQQFGNYRLLRLLGRGSFSHIYLARHEYFHTQVVLKLLDGRRSDNEKAKFLAQASVLHELQHPHILQVIDFGMEGETAFLVMDYAPNGTLRQRHPHGELVPPQMVACYVRQVASALHYVHQHKLIHRDVKPHNMLLGENDRVMLSDFGIAVVSQSLDPLDPGFYDFEGTVIYAAPEQLQGKPRRNSDQYALGIVVYEWLSGTRPFRGSFDEIVHQHLFVPPPSLLEQNPSLSPMIEQVVMKALAKEADERFSHVEDFANALIWAIEQGDADTSRQKPRRQFMSPLPFAQERT
jgi:serine/threonine protein kinase